ncbi:MAG: FAD/NAD(P)-binding protein, partial [Candidatus Thorarchaeota archaeon]
TPSRPGILEMGIRRTGKLTQALFMKKDNATVYVRGPYGNGFQIEPMVERDIIIVAGGLGVIPLRSILYYVLDNRDQFDELYFLYGARIPNEFLFRNEFLQIKERDDVDCLYSVDKDTTGDWSGSVGVVTNLFEKLPKINPKTTTAVVCGPPVMYEFVIKELLKLKIPKNMIQMTLERRMKCGVGKCGHCALDHIYTCMDGPVFTYWDTLHFRELI